jgi:hypothetical protein
MPSQVVVVQREDSLRRLMAEVLRDEGFAVLPLASIDEAAPAEWSDMGVAPDLVVLDTALDSAAQLERGHHAADGARSACTSALRAVHARWGVQVPLLALVRSADEAQALTRLQVPVLRLPADLAWLATLVARFAGAPSGIRDVRDRLVAVAAELEAELETLAADFDRWWLAPADQTRPERAQYWEGASLHQAIVTRLEVLTMVRRQIASDPRRALTSEVKRARAVS